jgi:tRNA (cmo5U34)-methyltransferase
MSRFDSKAETWDSSNTRVMIAQKSYEAMEAVLPLEKTMEVIDFGAGTGLLSRQIAPHVKSVLGIDTSQKMLEQLEALEIENIQTLYTDICDCPADKQYDGVISCMAMHHVADLDALFKKLSTIVKQDGFVAIADLMPEDGKFHADNDGVHHFGFDEEELFALLEKYGFAAMDYTPIFNIPKHDNRVFYGVFLLTAKR